MAPGPCLVANLVSLARLDAGAALGQREKLGDPLNLRITWGTISSGRPDGICRCSPVGVNRRFFERSGENLRHIGGKAPCGKNPAMVSHGGIFWLAGTL